MKSFCKKIFRKRPLCSQFILLTFFILVSQCDLKAQTLKEEAKMKAEHFKNAAFVKYMGDYFVMHKDIALNHNDPKDTSKWDKTLYQLKNVLFLLDSLPVSYLDSLNGYQWKGKLKITAAAYRDIVWSNKPKSEQFGMLLSQAAWSKWLVFDTIKIDITKRNSVWQGFWFDDNFYNRLPEIPEITAALLQPYY